MAVETADPVGEAADGLQVVLDPEHGDAGLAPVQQQPLEDLDAALVEGRHRFVQHQQLRRRYQALGQQHALALAAGEGAHAPTALGQHADPFQGRVDRRAPAARQAEEGRTALAHGSHEIVDGERQAAVELQRLRHVADAAGRAGPLQAQLAAMRHLPEQGLDQRTLAAAVRPDQRVHAAGLDAQAHAIEDAAAAEAQVDPGEVDGRPARRGAKPFGHGHAPDSWMARTTVSRLRAISSSYLPAL